MTSGLSDKLAEYKTKLLQILDEVNTLNLNDESEYFKKLTKINNFGTLFGYDGVDGKICDVYNLVDSTAGVTFAIKNMCYRRTCFYLMRFHESLDEAKESDNLNLLVTFFKKFRRNEKTYNGDRLRDFLLKLDPDQPSALAPLYETFIDSEIFTTLLMLEIFTRSPTVKKTAKEICFKLIDKLSIILSEFIDDNFGLRESKNYGLIKDEANIFWGLRFLFQEERKQFNLKNRFRGTKEFEDLFLNLLNRLTIFDSSQKHRISPNEDDLIFEVTPEIQTLEKTDLYVLFNLIKLISLNTKFSTKFSSELIRIINSELERLILTNTLPTNLYFLSLKYACLIMYKTLSQVEITNYFGSKKPKKIESIDTSTKMKSPKQVTKKSKSLITKNRTIKRAKRIKRKTIIDVAILTATREELNPVLGLIGGEKNWEIKSYKNFQYYIGTLPIKKRDGLRVVATSLWKYGPTRTSSEVNRLSDFNPRLLCMVGICAGWKGKGISLGDVIVADRAYQPLEGKFQSGTHRLDLDPYRPPPFIIQWLKNYIDDSWTKKIKIERPPDIRFQCLYSLLQMEQFGNDRLNQEIEWKLKIKWENFEQIKDILREKKLVTSKWRLSAQGKKCLATCVHVPKKRSVLRLEKKNPKVYYGAFATLPYVLEDHEFFETQYSYVRKIRAVDMELAAFFETCYEMGIPGMAAKAVCDYADINKNDIFHPYAAEVASRYLHGFLIKNKDGIRNLKFN